MSEPPTRFVVGRREGGQRLDRFLHARIPGLSRARIQRAIRERVTLSWLPRARPSTPVRPGGEVRVAYRPLDEPPLDLTIPVLARAAGWLAVDKPPSLPVHPVNRSRDNTVIRMLRAQEGDEALRLVHRLDRETSGVLVVARDAATARALSGAFLRGHVRKVYRALVRGRLAPAEGVCELPIGKDPDSPVYVKQAAVPDGRPSRTRWSVERTWDDRSLVRLAPESGRRHQLRVHLDALGHPILGDLLYGRPAADYLQLAREGHDPRAAGPGPRRQLLHAAALEFLDPDGDGVVRVDAPLPADFREHLPDPVP